MANTLKFGNGEWYGKDGSILAYNDENKNFKPLPFDFTRASTGTYVGSDGLIKTAGSNEPRVDYTDNTDGALLLEPSRSNFIPNSNNLTTWNGAAMTRTFVDDLINPSSILGGSKLTQTSSGGYAWLSRTFTGNETFSAFVKKDSSDFVRLYAANNTVYFNIVNGTIETEVGSDITDKSIVNYGNGWFRISMSVNSTIASYVRIYPASSGSSSSGTNSLFVYGSQLEQGSYATSYIPTNGSSVTRSAEQGINGGAGVSVFNNTTAVWFLDLERIGVDSDSSGSAIALRDSSFVQQIRVQFYSPSEQIRFRDGKSSFATISTITGMGAGDRKKIALRINNTTLSTFANGIKIGIDYTRPTAFDIDEIDFSTIGFKLYDMRFYNTALTDAELATLTT